MIDDLAMEFPHDTPQLAINTTGIGYLVNGTLNEENGVSLVGMDGAFLPKTGVVEIPFMDSDDINRTVQQYSSHHRVQRFLRNIITPIICVLGFLGNIINIIVLSRLRLLRNDGARDSGTHLGLTVLAVSDMLFCMSMFPRCLVPESLSLFEKKDFYLYYQVYGTGVVTCFMLTSTWITVVMALMRYVGICHPFSSRKIDGPIFSKVAYATVFVFCIILNLPSFFMYKIEDLDLGTQVVYLIDIGLVDQGSNEGQTFIWIKAILGILIQMTILSFCNCSLIRALRRSYRTRQQYRVHQTVSSTSNRITLTLIVIMMAFLILVFPSEIMDLLGDHINNSSSQTENFLTVRSFANVFQIINFAFNFVLYCVINVHFRGMLLQMLPCCRKWFPKTVAKFQRSAACARSPSYRTSDTALPVVNHRKRKTAETLLNEKV